MTPADTPRPDTRCTGCGRPLRSAKSIARGYGDRCAGAGHIPTALSLTSPTTPQPVAVVTAKSAQTATQARSHRDTQPAATVDVMTKETTPQLRKRLITQHRPLDVVLHTSSGTGERTAGIGYHEPSGRLEVLMADGTIRAYRDLRGSADLGLTWPAHHLGGILSSIDASAGHRYPSKAAAAAAAYGTRCPTCGEWANDDHRCPTRYRYSDATPPRDVRAIDAVTLEQPAADGEGPVRIRTYPPAQILDELDSTDNHTVIVPIRALIPAGRSHRYPDYYDSGRSLVEGTVLVTRRPEGDVDVFADPAHLSCGCAAYTRDRDCRHLRLAPDAMTNLLNDPRGSYGARVAAIHDSGSTDSGVAELPPDVSTFRYSDDPARFRADIQATLDRPPAGRVPFHHGDEAPVLYGYGASRRFGVELEFGSNDDDDSDDDDKDGGYYSWGGQRDRDNTKDQVAYALYAADLSSTTSVHDYHHAADYGYSRRTWGGWTIEEDSTVTGAEVVSPILRDTPDSWKALRRACTTITDNGGFPDASVGSHVTISAPDYAGDADRLTQLLRFTRSHEPDLYVAACAGHGRSTSTFTGRTPPAPTLGYLSVSDIQSTQSRYRTVNLSHIPDDTTDPTTSADARLEWRLWDGSLVPGRVQAQIRLSAAITDYCSRHHRTPPAADVTTAAVGGYLRPDHPDFDTQTLGIRTLIDTLFRRDQDKQQIMALWTAGLYDSNYRREH